MTSIDHDLERLSALLDDLRMRALRPGQVPYLGMQELGKFVEELHEAVGRALGFDWKKVRIDSWHLEMGRNGYSCHPSQFGPIDVIYGYRNIASHPNQEMHDIGFESVRRRLEDICDLTPQLVRLLTRHDLVSFLYSVQACSQAHLRAEKLRIAIADSGVPLQQVLDYAFPYIGERGRGFLKAPEERQLGFLLTTLGRSPLAHDSDVVGDLAKDLLGCSPDAKPIQEWIRRYGTPLSPGSVHPRVRMIRLSLDRDPRKLGGLLIRDVTVVEPPVPGLGDSLPEFPLSVPDPRQLPEAVAKILNRVGEAIRRHNARPGDPHHWTDFVLEIETPCDMVSIDFELFENRPGRSLVNQFRCVTLRPIAELYESLTPLRGIEAPIVHPRHLRNSIAVWRCADVAQLYLKGQGHDCLFTGPTAWKSGDTPPLVQAFEGFPGAVVCPEENDESLDLIYENQDERQWPDILDRITTLRKMQRLVKVLWKDPGCPPQIAETL